MQKKKKKLHLGSPLNQEKKFIIFFFCSQLLFDIRKKKKKRYGKYEGKKPFSFSGILKNYY